MGRFAPLWRRQSAAVSGAASLAARCSSSGESSSSTPSTSTTTGERYTDEERRRYNRMRHERDRANRRARRRAEAEAAGGCGGGSSGGRVTTAAAASAAAAAAAATTAGDALHIGDALHVVIDCSYATCANELHAPRFGARALEPAAAGATRSLAKQIELAAAAARRARPPMRLTLASITGPLAAACERAGGRAWRVEWREEGLETLLLRQRQQSPDGSSGDDGSNYSGSSNSSSSSSNGGRTGTAAALSPLPSPPPPSPPEVVMLTPDADEPLIGAPLSGAQAIYIIGGIVDRSVVKSLSLSWARAAGVRARRLPVRENAAALGLDFDGAHKNPSLAVSAAVAALAAAHASGGDWAAALGGVLPRRMTRTRPVGRGGGQGGGGGG